MARSSLGLQFTYKEEEEKVARRIPPEDFVSLGSRPCLIKERKKIPLLFLKIDFKYNLLLITVQSLNELNEQEGVVGIS